MFYDITVNLRTLESLQDKNNTDKHPLKHEDFNLRRKLYFPYHGQVDVI